MSTNKIIMVCFIISLVLMTLGTASASTITVNDSTGPVADFTSIQAAVDAVNTTDGDTIIVYPGTYVENVDVNKQLNITSTDSSAATHVTAASSSDDVFDVTGDGVTISGFYVSGASSASGIHLHGIENCLVINNKVSDSLYGISLSESISSIGMFESSNNTLINNTVENNGRAGINLYKSINNTLTSNTMSNNNYGIYLEFSNNNNLTSNTASNNSDSGIYLIHSSNNNLASNTASGNARNGIALYYDNTKNTLTSNTASNNSKSGIRLADSRDNTLTSNTASNNNYGILLDDLSNYNNLISNTISSNAKNGIYLDLASDSNTIYNNYFSNTNNVQIDDTCTGNIWNTTKTAGTNIIGGSCLGGNYWSDYGGVDTDCDSIGDIPYEIDVDNTDYLPLCLVTYNPYDENKDYVIDIGEVSAAIDDYLTQGSTSIADVNELIDMYRSGEPYCLVTYNPYDENEDCVIDIGEVNTAIDDYRRQGPTSIADVSELIDMYRSGEPYC